MSQHDLVAQLRAARPIAPPEVRERIRLIAAADTSAPRQWLTWRRSLLVLVPVAAALALALVLTQTSRQPQQTSAEKTLSPAGTFARARRAATTLQAQSSGADHGAAAGVPAPSTRRIQQYGASLELRVPGGVAVSNGVKHAVRIAVSYGGYPVTVHANAQRDGASADLVLKIPRAHVQAAVARLAQLGTIVAEQVDVQDLQAGINTTDRTIARLQKELATLRAEASTHAIAQRIAALTAQVVRLQRARSTTIREAHFATVALSLTTADVSAPAQHGHGPLHGLAVAFKWVGIGLVYALALGLPLLFVAVLAWLAARTLRRRREEALLSRP